MKRRLFLFGLAASSAIVAAAAPAFAASYAEDVIAQLTKLVVSPYDQRSIRLDR